MALTQVEYWRGIRRGKYTFNDEALRQCGANSDERGFLVTQRHPRRLCRRCAKDDHEQHAQGKADEYGEAQDGKVHDGSLPPYDTRRAMDETVVLHWPSS